MAILTKISWVKAELATNQQHIADFILAQPAGDYQSDLLG